MVSFSELELSHKIGSGAAGSVWRGSWRGAAVAVKVSARVVIEPSREHHKHRARALSCVFVAARLTVTPDYGSDVPFVLYQFFFVKECQEHWFVCGLAATNLCGFVV